MQRLSRLGLAFLLGALAACESGPSTSIVGGPDAQTPADARDVSAIDVVDVPAVPDAPDVTAADAPDAPLDVARATSPPAAPRARSAPRRRPCAT
jgi:hypothetical protein